VTDSIPLLFRWRKAFQSEDGPSSPVTRHCLLTLSTFMDEHGNNAFPSIATLAARTRLSERTVRTHLSLAATQGWIDRNLWREKGKDWANYRYSAVIPNKLIGTAAGSGPRTNVAEAGADGAAASSSLVRHDVPTNSSAISSNISLRTQDTPRFNRGQGFNACMKNARDLGLLKTRRQES
jgi:hypothetical protein